MVETAEQAKQVDLSVEEQVKQLIEKLEKLDRAYFGKDRQKQIKQLIDEATTILDTKPVDMAANKQDKAELLYLRGKVLDFLPEFSKTSEELLSKSIKLLPSKKEAWEALGHVYWKKQELLSSKKCFEGSLEQDEKNVAVLRNLSMVNRQIEEKDIAKRKDNFKLSIQLANKACALDMKDAQSWYVLGNAHLTCFFACDESIEQLNLALKAYSQTEKHMTEPNPDLYFNRATIYEYLERYQEAGRDYMLAHQIDPSLQGDKKADRIIDFVIQASTLIQNKGRMKNKKLTEMVKSVPDTLEGELMFPQLEEQEANASAQKYQITDLSQLQASENKGCLISAKVVTHLPKEQELPISFLIVDHKYNFMVASFYHAAKDFVEQVKPGDQLFVRDPTIIFTKLEFKGRLYSFHTVKIHSMTSVLVNNQAIVDNSSQGQIKVNSFA